MNSAATSEDKVAPPRSSEWSFETNAQSSDRELLKAYVETGNAGAFTLLFQRHWPLVLGVACRRTGNAVLAQDIAQAVFIVFSKKCHLLSPNTVPAGWLFRTTMFTVNNALKAEARRQRREEQATLNQNLEDPAPAAAWEALSRDLDEALASLPGADRDALLLRFMDHQSFRQIGEITGVNENAARQRVLRALDKLRRFLRKRGLVYSVGVISMAFGARPASASPPHQALVSQAAQSLALQMYSLLKWKKAKTIFGLGCALLAGMLALGILLSLRFQRNETLARWRTIQAVDMTFWPGDGMAFSDLISFGSADAARARRAFAGYTTEYHSLGRSFHEHFGPETPDRIGTLAVLSLMAGEKLREETSFNGRDHAVNKIVAGYSMHLIRDQGRWKWDLFENASQNEANRFLEKVEYQTEAFTRIRGQIDRVQFDSPEKAIQALHDDLSHVRQQ